MKKNIIHDGEKYREILENNNKNIFIDIALCRYWDMINVSNSFVM